MNICFSYKDYAIPHFFQGPQFVLIKEPSKMKNHKYPDNNKNLPLDEDDKCYDIAPYPPRPKERKPSRKRKGSDHNGGGKSHHKGGWDENKFDIKQEKKKGNKFWNN